MLTESVPDHTRFNAAAGSPGWSCPNNSPPGTVCTLAVADLPPGGQGTSFYAVTVDNPAGTGVIHNEVRITDSQGGGSDGGDSTFVGPPAPAPALHGAALATALIAVAAIARRRLRATAKR